MNLFTIYIRKILKYQDRRQQYIEEIYKVTKLPYYDIDVKNEIADIPNTDRIEDSLSVFCVQ
jgi:hypothetical protein